MLALSEAERNADKNSLAGQEPPDKQSQRKKTVGAHGCAPLSTVGRESVAHRDTSRPGRIAVVGLGPGGEEYLSLGALEALRRATSVFVRTQRHPIIGRLPALGIVAQPLDLVYESSDSLAEVYPGLAEEVIKAARSARGGTVAYAVPGHPLVAEESVKILLQRAEAEGLKVEIIPSVSSVELCLLRLGFDLLATLRSAYSAEVAEASPATKAGSEVATSLRSTSQGLRIADAQSHFQADAACATLFLQVDSRQTASEVKLSLLEAFPAEHEVTLLEAVGVPDKEKVLRFPLCELDQREEFTHLTSLFVPALAEEKRPATFAGLVEIMARLRSPEGCPWDREQTHLSLRPCLKEETEEVLEALDQGDPEALCEELGDLLLQVLFHAQLAAEAGDFDIGDILQGLQDKLVERHPHVFGGEKLNTAAEVLDAWEAIKAASGKTGRKAAAKR